MGVTKTPGQLVKLVRTKYNIPSAEGNGWPSDEDIRVLLGEALEKYQEMAMTVVDGRSLERVHEATVASGTIAVPTPSDFVRLVDGPFVSEDGGSWTRLSPVSRGFEGLVNAGGSGPELGWPDAYLLTENSIALAPAPDREIYLKFRYVAAPSLDLTNPDLDIDGPFGWADYVACLVCYELACADDKSSGVTNRERQLARAEMIARRALQGPDAAAIETIQDVRFETGEPLGDIERYEYLRTGPWTRRS